jgi:hypothetical protein
MRTCRCRAFLNHVPSHSPTKKCLDLSTKMSRSDMQTAVSRAESHGSWKCHDVSSMVAAASIPGMYQTLDTCVQKVTVQAQVLARDLDHPRSIQPVTREGSVRLVMTSPYQYQSFLDCSRPWNGLRRGTCNKNLDYVLEFWWTRKLLELERVTNCQPSCKREAMYRNLDHTMWLG